MLDEFGKEDAEEPFLEGGPSGTAEISHLQQYVSFAITSGESSCRDCQNERCKCKPGGRLDMRKGAEFQESSCTSCTSSTLCFQVHSVSQVFLVGRGS